MDNLLKSEDAERSQGFLIRGYADIDVSDLASQMRLRQLAWRVVEQVAIATDTHLEKTPSEFKEQLKQVYSKLVDVILVVDMPLDWLFPEEGRYDLDDIFGLAEGDTEDYQVKESAYSIVETLSLAMKELGVDENKLYYFLELAHYSFIRWANNENIKQEELLAA